MFPPLLGWDLPDSDKGKILMTLAFWLIFGCGLLAIGYGIYASRAVLAADAGNARMREISQPKF